MLSKSFFQQKLVKYLVRNLFHPITVEDILGVETNSKTLKQIIKFKGKSFSADQIVTLKENAENFERSLLWQFMKNQIKLESQEIMFRQSKVDNDLYFGKAILYELKVMEDLLVKIRDIQV